MKKLFRFGCIIGLLAFCFSCATMKNKNEVQGNVESVEFGKDGYTATVKTAKNDIYLATISIVNLGGPQNYKVFRTGDQVSLKGEIWKTDTEKHIKVTEILSAK